MEKKTSGDHGRSFLRVVMAIAIKEPWISQMAAE